MSYIEPEFAPTYKMGNLTVDQIGALKALLRFVDFNEGDSKPLADIWDALNGVPTTEYELRYLADEAIDPTVASYKNRIRNLIMFVKERK